MIPDDAETQPLLEAAGAEAVGQLPEREREILRLRFGLDGGSSLTREDVAAGSATWTAERVRQLEEKALAKLRRLDAAHLPRDNSEES